MGELFNRTQQSLIKRRENLLNGNINSIPSPFKRFRNDFVGLEQGTYSIITSYTKGKILHIKICYCRAVKKLTVLSHLNIFEA